MILFLKHLTFSNRVIGALLFFQSHYMRWNKKNLKLYNMLIRTCFCWVQRKNKLVWRMFTLYVVGFVNNDNVFFILLFFWEKILKVCVQLFCISQKMFSLNIAKWVYDIADCEYHDASCMVWKLMERKKETFRHFVQVVYMCGKNYWK